jgi:glycosyltransferase involved in cell wall biosynthesis
MRPMAGIDVVVPTYNRASLIAETLDAILSQSLPPGDVIVVDDGSTDETDAVLARYGDRVRVLRQVNSGDLVARNRGLRAATSPLVAFCDSDDLWQPGFLEHMTRLWQRAPGLTAAFADFRILQEGILSKTTKFDGAPADFWQESRDLGNGFCLFEHSVVRQLLRYQPLFPSAMVVDRNAFLALGGWDEGVSRILGCDFATALRVVNAPPLGLVRAPLVSIRKHSGNISADTERMNLGDARVLEHVLATRPELEPLRGAVEASIAERRVAAFHSAFARRDFAAVRAIRALLPAGGKSARYRVKAAMAALPGPLAWLLTAPLRRRG